VIIAAASTGALHARPLDERARRQHRIAGAAERRERPLVVSGAPGRREQQQPV
jgi:hypothetical protein